MRDWFDITYKGKNGDKIYYIRLGAFLEWIQKDLMYYFETGGTSTPVLSFDTDVQTNLMYIDPLQVSVDPEICVIQRNIYIDKQLYNFAIGGEPFESPLFANLDPNPYGQIMNIYVSMKFILIKLNELKDANTNKVVLIDFLNSILSSINSSLGGMNKLEPSIDETTGTLIIRDVNPLPNIENVIKKLNEIQKTYVIYDKYAQFDLYGYNKASGSASFIKDFNFTTEISPELSTMITVGATANSVVIGENSTAFSKFNAGLTDRFKEKIVVRPEFKTSEFLSETEAQSEEKQEQAAMKELQTKYIKLYIAYCDYIKKLSGLNPEYNGEAETYKDALSNYITWKQQWTYAYISNLVKKNPTKYKLPDKFTPGTGFIPFNMSLTMDGLSGMKIYSRFNIDTKYLPANYPENADFIIKNIQHSISNNKWFTKLESIVISQKGK